MCTLLIVMILASMCAVTTSGSERTQHELS